MNRATNLCKICNCNISRSNYTKHVAVCIGKPRPNIRRRNNLPAPIHIPRGQKKYHLNWDFTAIQDFYNNGKTVRDIIDTFGISTRTLFKAAKDGLFKTRSAVESKRIRGTLRGTYTEERLQKMREGGRKGGKRSAYIQRMRKRSKHEIYFAELCVQYFDNVLCNEPMFNGWDADIILPDHKLAIHWNGNAHYLPIFGEKNLHAVQVRDKIKHDTIERHGYQNYIIVDPFSNYNQKFVEEQFDVLKKRIII